MVCPICHQAMRQVSSDTRTEENTVKVYNRNKYECVGDDVWLTLEIPVDHAITQDFDNEKIVID